MFSILKREICLNLPEVPAWLLAATLFSFIGILFIFPTICDKAVKTTANSVKKGWDPVSFAGEKAKEERKQKTKEKLEKAKKIFGIDVIQTQSFGKNSFVLVLDKRGGANLLLGKNGICGEHKVISTFPDYHPNLSFSFRDENCGLLFHNKKPIYITEDGGRSWKIISTKPQASTLALNWEKGA